MTKEQNDLTAAYLAGWHANPGLWKTAVLDALTKTNMDTYNGQTPSSILAAIIDWHVAVDVQPAVSIDTLVAEFESTPEGASAMEQGRRWVSSLAQPVQPTPTMTCQTCEALARTVMMDQVGRAA